VNEAFSPSIYGKDEGLNNRKRSGPSTSAAGRRRNRRLDRDTCAKCGEKGHWQRSCPLRNSHSTNTQAKIGGVLSSSSYSETYLEFEVDGIKGQALIDSGCDRSVIPRRMVRSATLRPTNVELFAANGTKIPVLGCLRLNFTVQGKPLHADLLVSDAVDEFMLSCQWLAQNRCRWLFSEGILEIDGMPVKLKQRPARNCVRRVYVRETIAIPADMQMNVPVRLPINSFRSPKCDWLVEPKEIKPGLLVARTLLSDSDEFAAVRLINVSGKNTQGKSRDWPLPSAYYTTAHEHGVELERRVSAVRERNIGINKRLKASQFKQCN
jgi:hypothetical protein